MIVAEIIKNHNLVKVCSLIPMRLWFKHWLRTSIDQYILLSLETIVRVLTKKSCMF